ncbi:MAG: CRISPR-associated helicase Cas3' [Pseudomonadota bacterium]|nr:CRISPR-associated helicase Cas3' [Pseudomonadota bacterium]
MSMFRSKKKSEVLGCVTFIRCPAKTFLNEEGCFVPGRTVFDHCLIVGMVAREIINRISSCSHNLLFPDGAAFLAATHDVGKVSPTFYNKIMHACQLEVIPNIDFRLEKEWGGHAGVSQLTAKLLDAPDYVSEIIGQHHGFSPPVSGKRATDEIFGGVDWQLEREKLVYSLQKAFGEKWPDITSIAQARVLSGLTSVADWIGSGPFFENPEDPWEDKIQLALDDAGFIFPTYKIGLSFTDIFWFTAREAQSLLIAKAKSPGVYVLEAPMGLGKTEAALYAAYKMLETGKASGIYFALPTQLTSNKIYDRFEQFLESILSDGCQHRSLLLHANAWLLETEMGEEGQPGGAWFNQNKRGLLAPFAVGTIDQALMAVMNVKHGFVRAFGLAGKVVILDEVHTYDAYTGTILDALIKLLRELQCTVIILSATLNQERRHKLLDRQISGMDYPLITASPNDSESVQEVSVPIYENKQVKCSLHHNDNFVIEEALKRAEQGQQVLWIENTVKEAQLRYLDLAARSQEVGVACGLLHSRFTVDDRQKIEKEWVNFYGKAGWGTRQSHGRILIGTQVLEQSLDIDADFLISRFAPTDMLLQRLGRLWRHADTPRCNNAQPEMWILAPNLSEAIEDPFNAFAASAYVYNPYVLCRSLEVWQGQDVINLPSDIRNLIENTYVSRHERGAMKRWLHELENGSNTQYRKLKGRKALQQLARVGLSQSGYTLPENKAQTRYSESDSYEVLLLRALYKEHDHVVLTLLDGEQIELPLQRNKLTKKEWRKLTAILMRQIVKVPSGDKPKKNSIEFLKSFGLDNCFFLGSKDWPEDESVLHLALVDSTEFLYGINNAPIHDKYKIEYRDDLGYRVIKK